MRNMRRLMHLEVLVTIIKTWRCSTITINVAQYFNRYAKINTRKLVHHRTEKTMTDSKNLILSNDLFSDPRNIDNLDNEADILRHNEIADKLKEIVSNVETPANIALFGAWGSGKTWICKQVESKIKFENENLPNKSEQNIQQKKKVNFLTGRKNSINKKRKNGLKSGTGYVRYDAFKYVELPLLRTFIKVVAKNVLEESEYNKIKQEIKSSSEMSRTTNSPFESRSKKFACIGIIVILLLLSWWIFHLFDPSLSLYNYGTFAAAASALLTYIFGTRQVSHKQLGPKDSDEFEELFKNKIIDKMKYERLVIFIDELDRCSAQEMVNTLDVVRAFFDIDNCIIVVAVDRSVIEQALEQEARQSTPNNEDNPYYSTGGAYLEKVFQYQITIPPLWRYQGRECAEKMVKRKISSEIGKKSEFWNILENSGDLKTLLEILIPDYVTSPRRVKNLLNTFVMLCHIAKTKNIIEFDEGYSKDEIRTLAKFACLKVEFPMFARDMLKDPCLPHYVLQYLIDPMRPMPNNIDEDVWGIAKGYATKTRVASRFISDMSASARSLSKIDKVHGQHLLTYLSGTETIECPTFTLVYFDKYFSDDFDLGVLRQDKIIKYASMGKQKRGFLKEISKLKKEELSKAVSALLSHFDGESTLSDASILTSILAIPSDRIKLLDKIYIDMFIETSLSYSKKNLDFLDGDISNLLWERSKQASGRTKSKMRKHLIEWVYSLEEINRRSSDFVLNHLKDSLDANRSQTSDIIFRLLNSDEGSDVVKILFSFDERVVNVILSYFKRLMRRNTVFTRSDVLAALAEAAKNKQSNREQVLSILTNPKLKGTRKAVNIILSQEEFVTKDKNVLTYVFNALLDDISNNDSAVDFRQYEEWMKHFSIETIGDSHVCLMKKLYLKTIGSPDFALSERNIHVAALLHNFVSKLQSSYQRNLKAEIRSLLKENNAKEHRASAYVMMQYNEMLRGYGLLDQTQEANDLFNGVLKIINAPALEENVKNRNMRLLSDKLQNEFIELAPYFTEMQLFKLSRELMRCSWVDFEKDVSSEEDENIVTRASLIQDVSTIIGRLSEHDFERVDFSGVLSQLKRYPDDAVVPTLEWMKRFKDPHFAALIFKEFASMELLQDRDFSTAAGSLYRNWEPAQMKDFWDECFKVIASSSREDDVNNILAIAARQENSDMGDDEKHFVDWLVQRSHYCSTLKEWKMLLLLKNEARIKDNSNAIRLVKALVFPLFEFGEGQKFRDSSLPAIGVREVENISLEIFNDVRQEVEVCLNRALECFPELRFRINQVAQRWNLSLNDQPRIA